MGIEKKGLKGGTSFTKFFFSLVGVKVISCLSLDHLIVGLEKMGGDLDPLHFFIQ